VIAVDRDEAITPQMVRAARTSELEGVPFHALTLLGKRVAIFKARDGSYEALEMSCKHQGADLTAGRFDGGTVTCPRHGWRYDLASGACLDHPLTPRLRRHDVRVDGDEILVSLKPI
jgi:nitrite reductase/ring-hydroxylating ferredoxin subunit